MLPSSEGFLATLNVFGTARDECMHKTQRYIKKVSLHFPPFWTLEQGNSQKSRGYILWLVVLTMVFAVMGCDTVRSFKTRGATLCGLLNRGCYTVWSLKTRGATLCGLSNRGATLCGLSRQGVLYCVVFQIGGATLCGLSRQGVLHCVVFQIGGATLCGLSRQGVL